MRPLLKRILGSFAKPDAASSSVRSREVERTLSLCHVLLSERGEVSGTRLAGEVIGAYRSLDASERNLLFDGLVAEFSSDRNAVGRAAEAYRLDPSEANLLQLEGAIEPPRQELFRRINMAPRGISVLLDMRTHILKTLPEHPQRAGIDADLVHLFKSWFSRGFLVLQRIDWRTSALILERLIQYEAVHQIQGWRDLRRRLEADRRCYAFFHPALPDEPLIFIEIALTRGMSANVQPLLDPDSPVLDPADANCANFYSVTNCQEGLRGVSFGNLLIKQVAEDLGREFPRLRTFATLSPIPGFRKWLASVIDSLPAGVVSPELIALVAKPDVADALSDKAFPAPLRDELRRLCAYYLLFAKQNKGPLDPVARFHLANGARLERLNWLADTSTAGMQRSLGLMVNYVYRLADIERNHEAYARHYAIVAFHELERLAKQAPLRRTNAGQT
jgi:malonyl-CoA decarboxylase